MSSEKSGKAEDWSRSDDYYPSVKPDRAFATDKT